MKKYQKIMALLMCVSLILAVLSGCGSSATSANAVESQTPDAASALDEEDAVVPDEAFDEETDKNLSASESASEAATPQREPSVYTGSTVEPLSYPIGDPDDPTEFSIYMSWPSIFDEYIDSWNSLPRLETVTEATGVKIVFHEVSSASASEQFNLMIASGDMDDIIQAADYYVGGLGAAYSDEVIYDLSDIVEDNCPIYYDLVMNHCNDATRDVVLTSGKFLSINTLKDEIVSDMGLVARGDWLDELGMEVPTDMDEFLDVLYAMHNKYNCEQTIYVNNSGEVQFMDGVYGVSIFKVSGATDISPYLNDGVVESGIVSDEFREWLEQFQQLYVDGIVGADFYGNESTDADVWDHVSSGATGVWRMGADSIHLVPDYTENPNAYGVAIPKLVRHDGDKYLFGNQTAAADNKGFSITTNCDEPETVLQYFDWFFTDEGVLLTNYGKEGETYVFDENGTPRFTEAITAPENGMTMMVATIINTFSQLPMMNIVSKMWDGYTAEEEAAIHLWSDMSNDDNSHSYPTGAALNSDETLTISNQMTAVISYASEEVLKFITGATPIRDETWNSFVDNCFAQGLDDCLEVYNHAYQEFLAGERTVATAGPGAPPDGGGGPPPDGPAPDGPPPA